MKIILVMPIAARQNGISSIVLKFFRLSISSLTAAVLLVSIAATVPVENLVSFLYNEPSDKNF
ncbi:MAG: hypothetical protein IJ191_01955 [Treponema sp.]|nr:hypothetical protein [Treponema sp.]